MAVHGMPTSLLGKMSPGVWPNYLVLLYEHEDESGHQQTPAAKFREAVVAAERFPRRRELWKPSMSDAVGWMFIAT